MNILNKMFQDIWKYVSLITWVDVLDILIVAYLVYKLFALFRNTNTLRVVRGIVFIPIVMWLAELLGLRVLNQLLAGTVQVGVLALVILFQPELRRLLERLGRTRLASIIGRNIKGPGWEQAILQTIEACKALSWAREGALIIFERSSPLHDIAKTGTILDADITSELLKNIFYPKAPLHDGAVILSGGRILSAGCVLPLSGNHNLSRDLGMRHRAGLGITENSDAVAVIVSEETGSLSVAVGGVLKRHLAADTLERILHNELIGEQDDASPRRHFWDRLKGKKHG